uniref:Uncharacterized protein n=1 Tax=Arundo donax TaxID=35708 RepID=A0A0A9EUB3_ARUDO
MPQQLNPPLAPDFSRTPTHCEHWRRRGRGGPCRRCARCARAPSRRRAWNWARSRRRRGGPCRGGAPRSPARAPAARRGPRGRGAAAPPPASCTPPRPPPPSPSLSP